MPHKDFYVMRHSASVSTAITVMQLKAGTSAGFEIIAASVTQRGSTTSAQEEISIVRKSAAATVTTAVVGTHIFLGDPNASNPNLSLGTSATGVIGTAEGTDGDIIYREGFNVLNGWQYIPVPEGRIWVPPAGIIASKFTTAPAAQNWTFMIKIQEF